MKKLIFDDNGKIIGIKNLNLCLKECSNKEADTVIKKFHYSKKVTKNRFISLCVNKNLGYLQLGYGIRPTSKRNISKYINKNNYCEFDRMWLSDLLPKNSESQVISLLISYIKQKYKNIKFIITYADESVGNKGIIYQATNALYIGSIDVDFYVLESGERVHPVSMYHRHKTRAWETLQKIYPNIKHIKGNFKQRRFLYILSKKYADKVSREKHPISNRKGLVQFQLSAPYQKINE